VGHLEGGSLGKALALPINRLERPYRDKHSKGLYYKTFTVVIYGFSQKARVFTSGKPVQPNIMFPGTAVAYPSGAPERCSTL